ncbi:hypothetical protein GCM10028807_23500 [Spirosoma daeguense]
MKSILAVGFLSSLLVSTVVGQTPNTRYQTSTSQHPIQRPAVSTVYICGGGVLMLIMLINAMVLIDAVQQLAKLM